jgi:hypothetical protein
VAKRCTVCSHPAIQEINRSLLTGVPYRSLAAQFDLSLSALSRHNRHIVRERNLRMRQRDQEYQEGIMEKLALLDHRLDRLFNSALDLHSLNVSLGCIRESLRLSSLLERCRMDHGG